MTIGTQQLLELAERAGITGSNAIEFIKEQQEFARVERLEARQEAEEQRQEADRQRQEAERQRQHELEVLRLRERSEPNNDVRNVHIKKASKLPAFSENLDTMESYLQRIERFATANNWNREEWAVSLSAIINRKGFGRVFTTF